MDSVVFSGVGKRYRSLWALRDVHATFRRGEVVMVIGPNGSGKTTLIKCLLGLVRPTTGSIRVEGQVIGPDPGYRRSIGYMPQISQFPPSLTIGQLLDMMRDVRALSGGTMQKVSAVLAFRSRPRILVMDEPTAGLDPVSARTVLDRAAALRSDGGTVLITSHLMEEVEALADRIAYLQEGHLRFLLPLSDVLRRTGADRLALALPKLLADPV